MKTTPGRFPRALTRLTQSAFRVALLPALLLQLAPRSTQAGSATWKVSPGTNNWNRAANWTAGGPPNGPSDVATFAASNRTAISLSAGVEVNRTIFNPNASAFQITVGPALSLTLSGTGMTNNSAFAQTFVTAVDGFGNSGVITFSNSATAGDLTSFKNPGSAAIAYGGGEVFGDNANAGSAQFENGAGTASGGLGGYVDFYAGTAASAQFTNLGASVNGAGGGLVDFLYESNAGSASIQNNAGTVDGAGGGATYFYATSNASGASFQNLGASVSGAGSGATYFFETASAGSATFVANGGAAENAAGGFIQFHNNATAANAAFTLHGVTDAGALRAEVDFFEDSTAANGTLTILGDAVGFGDPGAIFFRDRSSAGNATLSINGNFASLLFNDDSTGGTARVKIALGGRLELFGHNPPGITVGSIEGDGNVILDGKSLTFGSNNLSTSFTGIILEIPDAGGALVKTGNGKFTLSGTNNNYSGGTTVNKGALLVTNKTGSATGTGVVQINGGTLGGTGRISGAVTVATGASASFLAPGTGKAPATLTLLSTLSFNSAATFKVDLDSSKAKADKVTAKGVTINNGAQFTLTDGGNGIMPSGTIFTVINNTSATPIVGTFSNLANGSIFSNNGNTYRASYTGGTGNDLTLTVQ